MSNEPGLVPELTVTDYEASRRFWCDLVGFSLRYERPEEGFGYLVLGNAHLMLDQIDQGRTWATGPLEFPLGRGINFEVQVDNLDGALQRITEAGWPIFVEPEEKWYRAGDVEIGVRQFLIQDPTDTLCGSSRSLERGPRSEDNLDGGAISILSRNGGCPS